MSVDNYFDYQSLYEMESKYLDFIRAIDDNEGVIEDDMLEKFSSISENIDEIIFRAENIRREFEDVIKNRKSRIEKLEAKQKADNNKVDFFKDIIVRLVKAKNSKNTKDNYYYKFNDISFTISKSESVETDGDFINPKYTNWSITDKFDQKIIETLTKHYPNMKLNKTIDKVKLKSDLEKGEIEGAYIKIKDKLTVR